MNEDEGKCDRVKKWINISGEKRELKAIRIKIRALFRLLFKMES